MIIQQRMWFRMARGVAESGQETERRHDDGRDVLTADGERRGLSLMSLMHFDARPELGKKLR